MPAEPEQGRNAQEEALKRAPPGAPHDQSFKVLAVAVLGVVYGDIGTSPIYALRESLPARTPRHHAGQRARHSLAHLLDIDSGHFSSSTWSYVLRADNRGEGGTFALLALLRPEKEQHRRRRAF